MFRVLVATLLFAFASCLPYLQHFVFDTTGAINGLGPTPSFQAQHEYLIESLAAKLLVDPLDILIAPSSGLQLSYLPIRRKSLLFGNTPLPKPTPSPVSVAPNPTPAAQPITSKPAQTQSQAQVSVKPSPRTG
jgi:hypothetical protein